MKGKGIWIIIALLAVVLVYLLFKGKSGTKTPGTFDPNTGTYTPVGTGSNMTGFLDSLSQSIPTNPPSASDCRQDCRQICGGLDDKLFGCGDRCQCKDGCKSACARNLDYQNMYPQ